MKQFLAALILLVVSYHHTTAQIPDSVIKKSNSIIFNDESVFTIEGIDKSSLKRKYDIVILNKNASSEKRVLLYYSKFSKVKSASVVHLSADNKVIKKYKLNDFQDWSADGSSLASDSRAKLLEINHSHYPFRLQVEYEQEYSGSLFYPAWQPQDEENQYVMSSSFKVINKTNNKFRHRSVNIDEPEKSVEDGIEVLTWNVTDLHPIRFETLNYNRDHYFPIVYTAPEKFQMDGYEGDLSSWESFGKWINKLNEGKNDLTEEQLTEVKALIEPGDSYLEKVKKVYKYMQSNTRYVSIQLGIGGWQPFNASLVHNKKYGDCKALSFYTQVLLDAVDIKSYYTLIRAGAFQRDLIEDFPASHFNHAILTVPMENDTIWLECTSQTNPFGYLGTFTSNRKALMITEDGARVIKTKDYTSEENVQRTSGTIKLDGEGTAKVAVHRQYQGLELENDGFEYMLLQPKSEQDKWFYDELNWGTFNITDYSLDELQEGVVPSGGFSANLIIKNAGSSAANRLFFRPSMLTNIDYMKLNSDSRTRDIEIKYPYTQYDSIILTPPQHFHIESNLKDEVNETPFGYYSREIIENEDGEFLFIRKFILQKGLYPAEEYQQFKKFIQDVQKADRQRLVFVNKT